MCRISCWKSMKTFCRFLLGVTLIFWVTNIIDCSKFYFKSFFQPFILCFLYLFPCLGLVIKSWIFLIYSNLLLRLLVMFYNFSTRVLHILKINFMSKCFMILVHMWKRSFKIVFSTLFLVIYRNILKIDLTFYAVLNFLCVSKNLLFYFSGFTSRK